MLGYQGIAWRPVARTDASSPTVWPANGRARRTRYIRPRRRRKSGVPGKSYCPNQPSSPRAGGGESDVRGLELVDGPWLGWFPPLPGRARWSFKHRVAYYSIFNPGRREGPRSQCMVDFPQQSPAETEYETCRSAVDQSAGVDRGACVPPPPNQYWFTATGY